VTSYHLDKACVVNEDFTMRGHLEGNVTADGSARERPGRGSNERA
jgi:hypothetical protein